MSYATSEEYDRAVHRFRMEQIAAAGVQAENRKAKAIEDQTVALTALAESVAIPLDRLADVKVACMDTLDQMDEAGIDAPLLREAINRLATAAKEVETHG